MVSALVRMIAVVLAVAALLPASAAVAGVKVSGVRAGDHGSVTRFVMDLDQSVAFKVYTLANPYRVIVDLPDVEWNAPDRLGHKRIGFIKGFRFGLFRHGNARIVIDLDGPAGVKQAFLIPPRDGAGWRFVLDLEPVSHAVFMQKQGAPGEPEAVAPQPAALVAPRQPVPVPAPEPKARDAKPVIVIDPGHGGVDPGAIGVSGIYEKELTLTMARQLKQEMERAGRYKVVLTRDRDIFLPLRDRVAKARSAGADLFVSLHADALADPRISGASVYTLSEKASDAEAAALAEKENKADLIAGMDLSHESPEVTNILIDLAQRETMNRSAGFAADLVDEIARETRLLRNTHRFAGFAVLKAPDVPSVLIELGYLSNEVEERQLRTTEYRARLAAAVARSVDRYFLNVQKAQRP